MKTTLFSSEKLSHWKAAILEKALYAWNQIRTTFSGPNVSKSQGPQVMILDHFYTIHQMYGPQILVFQKNLRTYTLW